MPKKTKKQKIAAVKRKQHSPSSPKSYSKSPREEKVISRPTQVEPTKKIFNDSKTPFTKDLYKSIFISAAILVFEIGLYIFQINGISITKFLSL